MSLLRPIYAPLFAISLLLCCPYSTAAQDDAAPTVNDALGLLSQQDYEGAVEMLTGILESDPDNARGWAMLGFAYQSQEMFPEAIEAHKKALEFESTAPNAMYNIAICEAKYGNVDQAFEWLDKAKQSNQVDLTAIGVDPNADSLRDDPRYQELFPSEEEFNDPFVEPVKIVHEWRGEAMGDQFGWIARNIGDVDGDGINDVTASAPTHASGGENAGRVYTYSGKSGELLWTADGKEGSQLGMGIEAAGDVNADGIPDVIAGAPNADEAFVYSGKDGAVLLTLKGEVEGDQFGRKVSDLGDLNGDGNDDVLVGAPSHDDDEEDAGAAYVFSGKDGSMLIKLVGERGGDQFGSAGAGLTQNGHSFVVVGAPNAGEGRRGRTYVYRGLSQEPAFVIDSDEKGVNLGGMFTSVVGDVNGDGTPDVYASDWYHGAEGPVTGQIYVHSGTDGARLLVLPGESRGDGFGIGPADAGDVNDDGYDDLVIGAWRQDDAAAAGGKIYVYSGKDGSLMASYTGKVQGETLGFDATGMGDVDGDGAIDYLVTSAWSAVNGTRSGRMYILSGKVE